MSKYVDSQGKIGAKSGKVSPARDYLTQAVKKRQWELEQRKKSQFGCRTLEDMSEEEILALEAHYKCPVIRPERKRAIVGDLTFYALKVPEAEGWAGYCWNIPGVTKWGQDWQAALLNIQSVYIDPGPISADDAEVAQAA